MEAIVLKNFKYGLDTRRDLLTSQPGTLVTLTDAHINQGAEIEGRKAWVKVGSIPTGNAQTTLDLLAVTNPVTHVPSLATFSGYNTFRTSTFRSRTATVATVTLTFPPGASDSSSLNVFFQVGDVVNISGFGGTGYNGSGIFITAVSATTISYNTTSGSTPESITADTGGNVTLKSYSGLVVPIELSYPFDPAVFPRPTLTAITASCAFNGKAWCSATFGSATKGIYSTDGGTILYYNGVPILPSYLGIIHMRADNVGDQTPIMALQLAPAITTYLGPTFTGTVFNSSDVIVTGPVNVPFTITTAVSSQTGTFVVDTSHGSAAGPAITAVSATTTFYLVSGASGSINTIVDNASVALISGAVNFSTSLYHTAQLVANAINALTATTGYTAQASLASTNVAAVVVTAPQTAGASPATPITVNSTTIKVDSSINGAGATGNTTYVLAGGVTGQAATPQTTYLDFGGSAQWAFGDTWALTLVFNNTQYTIGAGNIAGLTPTFAMSLGTKVNFVSGTTWAFSAVGDGTLWENQNTGAGNIVVADQSFSPSSLVAVAPFQGKVAVFAKQNAQIWNVASLPSQYTQAQIFQNVGAIAAQSVQALGELDVFFLSYFGIRSFRVLETTLNAFLTDVGSPIDTLITASLLAGTDQSNSAACGCIEPTSHRYFLYLNGVIYVLSYFPSLKISAWSTYTPTFLTNLGTPESNVMFNYTLIPGNKYYFSPGNCVSAVDTGGPTVYPGGLALDGSFVAVGTQLTVTTSSLDLPGTAQLIQVNTFTPIKFVVFGTSVYVLASDGSIYQYGGPNGTSYDGTVATVELPWLDDGDPLLEKRMRSVAWVSAGKWVKYYAVDPLSGQFHIFDDDGSDSTPSVLTDSSFPFSGKCGISGVATHFKGLLYSDFLNTGQVVLGAFALTYEAGKTK